MSTEINPHDKRGLSDLELIEELYLYLQNKDLPIEAGIPDKSGIKLTPEKAFRVIWFLQEHLRIIPDNIERCQFCDDLYDTHCSGLYLKESYNGMNSFCDSCMDQVPDEQH